MKNTGIYGNDKADLLTQRARKLNNIRNILLDPEQRIHLWKKHIRKIWETDWQNSSKQKDNRFANISFASSPKIILPN